MTGKIGKVFSSKPIRMWIDGKCFNIRGFKDKLKRASIKEQSPTLEFSNDSKFPEIAIPTKEKQNDFRNLLNPSFSKDEEGRPYTAFELPKFYYKKLSGQTNFNVKSLAEQTKTQIEIPTFDQGGKVKIIADNEENLNEALDEILSVIGFIRDNNIALQFATIPLLSEEIQSNFEKFKKNILEDEEVKDIDASLFIKKEKLHLTINIFVLFDEKEIQEAINALNDYTNFCLIPLLKKTGLLKIQVKGIDCMKSNYKKANVVYAKAKILDETQEINLQKITDDLSNYFYNRGLLKRHQESVKIHMTLMNVKYRKVSTGGKKRKSRNHTIDATKIIEKYGDYNFGVCDLNSIRIAYISASPGKDGFYKTISEVKLQELVSKSDTHELQQVKNVEHPFEDGFSEKMECCELPKHESTSPENSTVDAKDNGLDINTDCEETRITGEKLQKILSENDLPQTSIENETHLSKNPDETHANKT